jgi:hypothetical protein
MSPAVATLRAETRAAVSTGVFAHLVRGVQMATYERRLSPIVLADVVAYSRMIGLDEVGTLAALDRCRARSNKRTHSGRAAKRAALGTE